MKSIQIKITYDDGRVVELSPDVEVVNCMCRHTNRSLNHRVKFMDNIILRAIELVKVLQG
jgi:hypothetical protein